MIMGQRFLLAVLFGCAAGGACPASAGDDCCPSERCRPACKPRRHCCLCPPEAPRGEVAFAIPGVVRDGAALRVSDTSVETALRRAAALELRAEADLKGDAACDKTCEERLDKLESDVKEMKTLMGRMSVAVEKLAKREPGQ